MAVDQNNTIINLGESLVYKFLHIKTLSDQELARLLPKKKSISIIKLENCVQPIFEQYKEDERKNKIFKL